MVGMVEIELDKETGAVKILDYQAVAVSYTHLDVYKRQDAGPCCIRGGF